MRDSETLRTLTLGPDIDRSFVDDRIDGDLHGFPSSRSTQLLVNEQEEIYLCSRTREERISSFL